MGFPLQFWQTVVFWLWFVSVGAGALAVAASFSSSVISYYLSDETQRAATAQTTRANAIAAQAQEVAAQANERAASLERKQNRAA